MSIFLCVIFSICGQGCGCGYSTVAKCNQLNSRLTDTQHKSTHPYMEFSDPNLHFYRYLQTSAFRHSNIVHLYVQTVEFLHSQCD